MDSLKQHALGATLPVSPHAVACSLPTVADVVGYEEKAPAVVAALRSGYPRFVRHAYLRELEALARKSEGWGAEDAVFLVLPETPLDALLPDAGDRANLTVFDYAPCCRILRLPAGHRAAPTVGKRIQHIGCVLSSRAAEALLVEAGLLPEPFAEERDPVAAPSVCQSIAQLLGSEVDATWLTNSGMGAFFSAFEAVRAVQRPRGRGLWVQLGWLYVDTGKILQSFLSDDERLVSLSAVDDLAALETLIQANPNQLAGVVIETPTNPLVQVADLARLRTIVREAGGILIADPSIASAFNVDVFPLADICVQSLTKYTGWSGDIMMGVLALNPDAPDRAALHAHIAAGIVPPAALDLARMAWALPQAAAKVARMNANALRLAELLQAHPAVGGLWWSGAPASADAYARIRRAPENNGAILTISLKGQFKVFYDAIEAFNGPSFGAEFTIVCPYLYLAHYDLVSTAEGRRALEAEGLDPYLVRISVGCEPIERLLAVFEAALAAALGAGTPD